MVRSTRCAVALAAAVAILSTGCGGGDGAGDLHARRVVLQRQVEGLRQLVERVESGAPVVPEDDVVVAIDQSLVRDLIVAQLPIEVEAGMYRVWLDQAEVTFEGSLLVTLAGGISLRWLPVVKGAVRLYGALENIRVDEASGTLRSGVAVEHLDLLELAGLERLLGQGRRDELARSIRLQLDGHIPEITLPVEVQQSIEIPAVSEGPVRIQGATLPLEVAVSDVLAGPGQLWVAIHVQPGEFIKTGQRPYAPEAGP